MDSIKACTHCGNEYPATNEYFVLRKDSKHGLTSWCKVCIAERSIQMRLRKGGKRAQYVQRKDGLKQCTKCQEWLPETSEYFNRNKRVLGGMASWCKSCSKEYNVQRRINNPEKVKAEKRAEYQRNKSRYKVWGERYYQENRVKRIEYARRQPRNPMGDLIRLHRRLARKRELPDNFTEVEWIACLEYFNYQCAVCGCKDRPIQMDHWIPLNDPDCPGTVAKNIVPLCGQTDGCNQSKNRKRPNVWLAKHYGEKETKRIMNEIERYFESVN